MHARSLSHTLNDDFRVAVERGGIVRRLHKRDDGEPLQKLDRP